MNISDQNLKYISQLFIGDIDPSYSYKNGKKIVDFFNVEFNCNDEYGQDFPTRWKFVSDKLEELLEKGQLNNFFNVILETNFIKQDKEIYKVEEVEQFRNNILEQINDRLSIDNIKIIYRRDRKETNLIHCKKNKIGSGGFADVYDSGHGIVTKKLKEEYLNDEGVKNRFKREFKLTKYLGDISGIIKVFDFDNSDYCYTMEKAEYNLKEYIEINPNTGEELRVKIIKRILMIMKEVHNKNILHRDLSPTNILIVEKSLKIADFGLGKSLDIVHSHLTEKTNSWGQLDYCSPEQINGLKDGDKKSDVFSLGRLINFIMTGNPKDYEHKLKTISKKSAHPNREVRYGDASIMYEDLEKYLDISQKKVYIEQQKKNVSANSIIEFIYEMKGVDICNEMTKNTKFRHALFKYIKRYEGEAEYFMEIIKSTCMNGYFEWSDYDIFSSFSSLVIKDNSFNIIVKELAAHLLLYIATDKNRFNAAGLIEDLLKGNIDPIIEDILKEKSAN